MSLRLEQTGRSQTERVPYPPLYAYLFDVDGVLTNPWTKKVEKVELFIQLEKRLGMGMIICLNSGRAQNFLEQEILDPLKNRLNDTSLMNNVVAIGEKGGGLIVHDTSGRRTVQIEKDLQVPQSIQNKVKTLLGEKYSDTMFYDDTKQTMVTLEVLPAAQMGGQTPDDFKRAQKKLCADLQAILDGAGLSSQFRVDPTGIATDVESVLAGKAHGAEIFIRYLNDRGIRPDQFKCFGDSKSDIEMHKRLKELELPSEFIFVGNRENFDPAQKDGIIFISGEFNDTATLKYLSEEKFDYLQE